MGNLWVYTEKDDGIYRSRAVAKGFSQVPGKDFQEHHAPVVHDITVCLDFVLKLIYYLSYRQFDIVTALYMVYWMKRYRCNFLKDMKNW
jgi:Reverse transcriptase (RNA-dependent DNA polymerase)